MESYAALATRRLGAGAALMQAQPWQTQRVTLESPALAVMTDLAQVKAATTAPGTSLKQAEQAMIYLGVRMLFVVSAMPAIEGLVTTTDLHGHRQMQLVHERGARYDELTVADVMSPLSMLDAIDHQRLQSARVGHLVATLQAFGRNHLLVVETGGERVRGVVSRAQIERQLGTPVEVGEVARSFAEIERLLA